MSIASQIINYEYFLSMCPQSLMLKFIAFCSYISEMMLFLLVLSFYKTWPFFFSNVSSFSEQIEFKKYR